MRVKSRCCSTISIKRTSCWAEYERFSPCSSQTSYYKWQKCGVNRNVPLQIIDATKAWRDAWTAILTHQTRLVHEFEGLYAPIIGASDPTSSRPAVATPQETLARTNRLYEEYEELRKDLLVEVNAVDDRMIRPAQEAKDLLQPLKKTMKKRDDKKVRRSSIYLGILQSLQLIPWSSAGL
jgi:hypothetical protein